MNYYKSAWIFFSCALMGCGYAELQDPLVGKRHIILDFEYVYLHRAPKIHNRDPIASLETHKVPGFPEPLTVTACPNSSFKPNQILAQQGFASGARITANYLINKQTNWQARYLGFLHWTGQKTADCPHSLQFPFTNNLNNTVDYQNADRMRGLCDTYFWSGEVNYWGIVTPRRVDYFSVSWVFGLKYVNLRENFKLSSYTTSYNRHSSSDYKIDTKNRMAGFQLGGDLEGNLGYNFTWGIIGKVGTLVNFAENNTLFLDDNNTAVIKKYNPSDFNLTFLGELAPFVLFNLSKNILFKISYEVTYLSNVALAMNQITFIQSSMADLRTRVNNGGYFMIYGAFVGLGFDF